MRTTSRLLRRDDVDDVVAIVVAAGLFEADDAEIVSELLGADRTEAIPLVAVDESGELCGVVYAEPRPGTDRLWELTMLAVLPRAQRGGVGRLLVDEVERRTRERGGRMLVVETSDAPAFASARAFYERRGYERVAHVTDWWAEGDGLVVYRRSIRTTDTAPD